MQHHFRIRGGLTDGARRDDLATQRQAIGEIAVMGNGDAAFFQFGKQWLHMRSATSPVVGITVWPIDAEPGNFASVTGLV